MPLATIRTDLDKDPWNDLPRSTPSGEITRMGRMTKGTQGGRSVVFVAVTLPDGSTVTGQTTMRLFQMAAAAFRGAEERDGLSEGETAPQGGN